METFIVTGFTSKRRIALDRLDDDDIQIYAQPDLKGKEHMKEALKLALEALETADETEFWNKQKEAITAIKEALAQPPLPVQPEPSSECNPQDLCAGCRCKYSAQPPLPVQPEQGPLRVDRDKATHDGIVKAFAGKELMPGLPMPEPDVIEFGEEYELDNTSYSESLLRSMVATAVAIKDAEIAQLQALAQQAQGPVIFYRCKGCGHAYEGVAPSSCDCMEGTGFEQVEYFTAPPKRPWVGLTDEEIDKWTPEIHGVIRIVEQALKEKNT